jgi:hypothetical protein
MALRPNIGAYFYLVRHVQALPKVYYVKDFTKLLLK